MLYKTCSIKSTRRWILVAIFKRNTDCVLFYVKQMICRGRLCFSILTDLVHKQWEKTGHVENFKSNFKHSFTRTVFFKYKPSVERCKHIWILSNTFELFLASHSLQYFINVFQKYIHISYFCIFHKTSSITNMLKMSIAKEFHCKYKKYMYTKCTCTLCC